MKHLVIIPTLTFVIVSLLFFCGCQDDNLLSEVPEPKEMPFKIVLNSPSESDVILKSIAQATEDYELLISVEAMNGEQIYNLTSTSLNFIENNLTVILPLVEGDYQITEFIVADKYNNPVLVSPKVNSSMSPNVNAPIPFNFKVSNEGVNKSNIEVLEAMEIDLRDFGYYDLMERNLVRNSFNKMFGIIEDVRDYFEFRITAPPDTKLTIDWGDGQQEERVISHGGYLFHEYTNWDKDHFIKISGDLDKIIGMSFYYGDASFKKIFPQHLSSLQAFEMSLTQVTSINLSNIHTLRYIDVSWSILESLKISNRAPVTYISVSLTDLTATAFDQLVNNLYHTVKRLNLHNGRFEFIDFLSDCPAYTLTPSEKAFDQLKFLMENYNWTIDPSPYDPCDCEGCEVACPC